MTPEEASQRAERAKQLLSDELLKASFAANIEILIQRCSEAKDEKEAYRACMALKATIDAQRSIASHIETAKLAQFNFSDEKKRSWW